MNPFEFSTAGRILFGRGRFADAGALADELGSRPIVVTGRSPERPAALIDQLSARHLTAVRFVVPREPTIDDVRRGVAAVREHACDCVIGLGGGSPLDAGKAIAAVAANAGDVTDYLEVVGRGQPLTRSALPYLAIPTTAGTGSEDTRNAVLTSPEHQVKASLRSPSMLPRVALVDPDLTISMPPDVTAATGLDAITQLIEAYLSRRATPVSDVLARDGIRRAAGALGRAIEDGSDVNAREPMALASLFGGIALSSAGLGAVHALASPLGGLFGAPHGALCGALLPSVLEVNARALAARAPDHPAAARLAEVARLLTGRPSARIADGVAWLRTLTADAGVPRLRAYGVTPDRVGGVVAHALRANSMKTNPIDLMPQELAAAVTDAW